MTINKMLLLILASSLVLRIILIFINSNDPTFAFLQENYDLYLTGLKNGTIDNPGFSVYETRMFPGYILLLFPFTFIITDIIQIGIFLNLIIFGISFYLIWVIFKNVFINFLFSFFPPIWIIQSTKASSEPLTVMLLLASLLAFIKKYYFLTGLIIGIAFNVRIISACLFLAIFIVLIFGKKINESLKLLLGFLLTSSLLIIYNYLIFGNNNLFIQFTNLNQNYGVVTIGFIQIFKDILRTIDWEQYKILFSGLFYLIINIGSILILFKFRNNSHIIKICFYWALFSLVFVFLLSPFTLIENFGRYALPALPAVCVAIDLLVKMLDEKSSLIPKKPKFSSNQKRVKTH